MDEAQLKSDTAAELTLPNAFDASARGGGGDGVPPRSDIKLVYLETFGCQMNKLDREFTEYARDPRFRSEGHRAYVSIMRGCDLNCTYCIVPMTRGIEESRALAEIVREVEGLVADGVKEVTLLGQTVNSWGKQLP